MPREYFIHEKRGNMGKPYAHRFLNELGICRVRGKDWFFFSEKAQPCAPKPCTLANWATPRYYFTVISPLSERVCEPALPEEVPHSFPNENLFELFVRTNFLLFFLPTKSESYSVPVWLEDPIQMKITVKFIDYFYWKRSGNPLSEQPEVSHRFLSSLSRNKRVNLSRLNALMTHHILNHPQINSILHTKPTKRVTKHMRSNFHPRGFRNPLEENLDVLRRKPLVRFHTREEPYRGLP